MLCNRKNVAANFISVYENFVSVAAFQIYFVSRAAVYFRNFCLVPRFREARLHFKAVFLRLNPANILRYRPIQPPCRITARRRKSRENAKRKKTIQVFPIFNWNRWRGYCCPQSENIFRRRRDEKIMPNGKRTRLKKPHYNLIKNLNVKTVPLTTTEPCFPE